MKILLINEPFVPGFCRTQRWAARTRGRVLRAPDWLAYATAVLEKAGHEAKLYDFPAMEWEKDKIAELAKKENPHFVVLDSTTPSVYSDIDCAKIIKANSNAKVIMVGPHISALPEETLLEANGLVDVAVIGEYDNTVLDIVNSYPNLSEVKGIVYIKEGKPVRTPARPLIENLDSLPFPAWHQLDLMKYFDGGKLYPYIDIISGRGCPNACIFCLWPQTMHGYKFRFRSAKNVVDEIEHDIKLCPQVLKGGEFFFEDDTFTVNKARAIEICEEIMRRNLKIRFSVNARVDTADAEMFKIMKKAGCRLLLVGFESGVQDLLNKMHKNITITQSRNFMALAKQAKLQVHGCFVIGLPGETLETAKQTVGFGLNLGLDTIQFSGAVPFPGTKYFKLCEENGWLKSKKWSDYLQEGEQAGVVEYPGMSREQIDKLVDAGLKSFYFRPSYMVKFLLKTSSPSDLYRKFRGAKNFISYLLGKK
ncbi:MAG: B12-binding domain-containing radical SAM protein [Elusimicrobia bacterium RIFOXYA2_FULL_39_19]|nr:MAG: B12-binding domain-containing radical SAM protein [Elusimicrobia bacterium RIFOXYA2_FULL_39_19]